MDIPIVYYNRCTCFHNHTLDIKSNLCLKRTFLIECPFNGYFNLKICSDTFRSMYLSYIKDDVYGSNYYKLLNFKEKIFEEVLNLQFEKRLLNNSKKLSDVYINHTIYKNHVVRLNLLELISSFIDRENHGRLSISLVVNGLNNYLCILGNFKKYHTIKEKTIRLINKLKNNNGLDNKELLIDIFLEIFKLKQYEQTDK